jgi:Ca2+-binding RTX toxin-like protein
MAFIFGNATSETLNGTDVNDIIAAEGGNDTVKALAGDDLVLGGSGNDTLSGGDGNDTLFGEDGDDVIVGDRGDDIMIGGLGNDRLIWNNGDGSDLMIGNDGIDVIEANGAAVGDVFTLGKDGTKAIFDRTNLVPFKLTVETSEQFEANGLGGDDSFTISDLSGTDVQRIGFAGGAGNDTLDGSQTSTKIIAYGDEGNDKLLGGSANDYLFGGDGDDRVDGEKGDDTMIGGAGNDTLGWDDGDGNDLISGGDGYDIVEVTGGDAKNEIFTLKKDGDKAIFDRTNLVPFKLTVDTSEQFDVRGLGGDDSFTIGDLTGTGVQVVRFSGGAGNDTLDGSQTSTKIIAYGDEGNDILAGGSADDQLYGGKGTDLLIGGGGYDTLTGGEGYDGFGFWSATQGVDTITDFVVTDDVILVSAKGFGGGLTPGGFLRAEQFTLGASSQDYGDRFIYNGTTGALYFDIDGKGGAAQVQIASLSPNLAMSKQNIFVI